MRVQQITDKDEMTAVIKKSQVCHLAMVDEDGKPYLVPMNFGYEDGYIYLHGAQQGRKMDILKNNPAVAVNFTTDHELKYQSEHVACSYSMKYRSVTVEGDIEFIEDKDRKIKALDIIMAQYSDREFKYNDPALREVSTYRVIMREITGRKMHYR